MNKKLLTLSTTAIAAAIALAGCSSGSGSGSTPGMNHGSSSSAPAPSAEHNSADVTFAQMMIPHHAQAVEMAEMILAKKDIPAPVTALATKIKEAQGPEIRTMTGWLDDWNEPTEMASGHAGHSMDGMLDDASLKELDAAQGTGAAKLFLKQMIAHHEGAIMMANTEKTGGKDPKAVDLGNQIVSAQEAEIKEMQGLLTTL
ncbi:DUF305 domain-containing protein [Pseudarthrobacter cellobiosi]|uniref:DUF305 domain-containing protein n=1 Tax=Pseudarthrobacter cellobiosi TaxID=2953654 RepID=UPI00208DEDD8|nr:DUF305 domain-containing protein [Pseudarthrobacter sp. HLT1-5]MCO4254723.1 DUF305 domain-containing protein [Pseudarthrobacter sp. HLT1-5]